MDAKIWCKSRRSTDNLDRFLINYSVNIRAIVMKLLEEKN